MPVQIISAIKFPKSSDTAALYMQGSPDLALDRPVENQVILQEGSVLSFNTYFNSFYESFYAKYTTLNSIYYLLKLEGDFQIAVYREVYGGSDRQLIATKLFDNCQHSEPIQVSLPDFDTSPIKGRIYCEITCLSPQGVFEAGWIATNQLANREVSLAIVSCTFKKEKYIKNTVNAILQEQSLHNKRFKVFVVDNGRTLAEQEFEDERVQLIPNRNLGGAGGFTRGLVEALQEDVYSHILFMDDDVELEGDVIQKLFSLYEYAESDFAVAGSMLDLYKKHVLWEAGAVYARSLLESGSLKSGYEPFELAPLKNKLDLQAPDSLNTLLLEEPVDYGAFWFFAFPKRFVDEIGLPMPFFIKGDDVEYSLRIKQQFQDKLIAFPSIAVWHEPFYAKFPVWDTYYYFRNFLITHAINGSLGYTDAVKDITKRICYTLLFFDYNYAGMLVKAFEDFAKGPEFIKNSDPEALHADILRLSKIHKNQNIEYNYSPPQKPTHVTRSGIPKKIASLLTLNGHFLPKFLINQGDEFIWHGPNYPGQRSKAFGKQKISVFREEIDCLFQYEMNQAAGLKILTRWLSVVIQNRFRWTSINAKWKNSAQELISTVFWQKYLQLKE
jgi:galactofuranosylgalactofuranosylrhamnosyl-N-acetylglucosaminyl-diphospho-decaprenol beta-1,5/1,6-galactofuranosyltransferase